MYKIETVLNELLVRLFNEILLIEQLSLSRDNFKDLSIAEIHTIEAIGEGKPRTMSEVAIDLKITVGTLTTAINNLVRKGYVERKKIEEDRRFVLVELTEEGRVVNKVHEEFHSKMVNKVIAGLSTKEKESLVSALQKLTDFFRTEYIVGNLEGRDK